MVHPTARADVLVGSLLAACAGGLYGVTMCRSLYWYDSAEYATAAYTLGVPHPPGYPLYTLVAHAFVWLLPASPALAVNLLSAVSAVVALVLCYACGRALGSGRLAAAAGAALLATGNSFWFNATVAEVYALGLCFALSALWLLLRAQATGEARLALLAAGVAGAGMGVHYAIATLGLGYAWLAAQPSLRAPRGERAWLVVRALASCAAVALALFGVGLGWLLVRANADVQPNQAHPLGLARFTWLVLGGNYRLWFTEDSGFIDRVREVAAIVVSELSFPGIALALAGIALLATKAPARATALLLAMAGNLAFFFGYRVADLEVFLLPTVALLSVCASLGAHALLDRAIPPVYRTRAALILPLFMLVISGQRLATDYATHNLRDFHDAYDYGSRLSAQLPYRAVILNYTTPEEWKYDAVFGLYFQNVLGRRHDVVVAKSVERAVLDRLLDEGRHVYLYASVARVAREYTLEKEGDLYRVTSRR